MQKRSLEALFLSPSLLIPKSRTFRSSLLHSTTIDHLRPTGGLKIWSSEKRLLKRDCQKVVIGLYRRQMRWESTMEKAIGSEKEKQRRAPWHREGSDTPPVARQRSAGAMVKGSRIFTRVSTLTDAMPRKTIDNPVSPSQAHYTSYHS